jgi:hypothetical protein
MNQVSRSSYTLSFALSIILISIGLTSCGSSSEATTENSKMESVKQEVIVDDTNPLNLNDEGLARVNKILNEVGSDDPILNALTNCISKYYDELNATFIDANLRGLPMANIQDCTEELNPDAFCRPADDGTGPICGLADKRTGYSLASIFGYMTN